MAAVYKTAIGKMTAAEIAALRDMQRKIFILFRATFAAGELYAEMLDAHNLFDMSDTNAQYDLYRKIQTEYDALDDEYHQTYLKDTEED